MLGIRQEVSEEEWPFSAGDRFRVGWEQFTSWFSRLTNVVYCVFWLEWRQVEPSVCSWGWEQARFQPGWSLAGAGQGAGKGTVPVVTVATVSVFSVPGRAGLRHRALLGAGTAACPGHSPAQPPQAQQHITNLSWLFPACSRLLRHGKYNNLVEKGLGAPSAHPGVGLGCFLSLLDLFPPSFPTHFCFPVDSCLEAAVCFGQCVLTPSWCHILRVMDDPGDLFSLLLDCVSMEWTEAAPGAAAGVKRPLQSR